MLGMDVTAESALKNETGVIASPSPCDASARSIVKACLLATVTVLIVVCNSACLIVLRYTRGGVHPVTKLFLVSLTVSDLLVGVLIGAPVTGSTALNCWFYGSAYCTVVAASNALYFNAGLSVMAINVERYIAVVRPLRYPSVVTLRRAIIAEVGVLTILAVWDLLYILIPGRSTFYYSNFNVCFIDSDIGVDVVGQVGITAFIALPTLTGIVLQFHLVYLVAPGRVNSVVIGYKNPRENSGTIRRRKSRRQRNRRQGANADVKAARTFCMMAVVTAVSWTPYYLVISWENYRSEPVSEPVAFASQILLLLNSLWNVAIYYSRNGPFRKTANRLLGCCFRVQSGNGESCLRYT